jgi:predicted nucleotidyltransferase
MRRSDLLEKIKALQPELKAEGVDHVALFGSRARGEDAATSDVDLLIEVDATRRFSLLDLIGVEQIVEEATGIPSHALMRRSLEQEFASSIAGDVIEIF